jgi:hypothetical protein
MAKNYIFSTLANDQLYTNWIKGGADLPIKGPSVLVKGGTGVANDRLITPIGVATEVSDEELAQLELNQVFTKHKQDGFITIRTKKAEAEKVASDMNMKDKSAPLTPASFTEEDQPKMAA